MTTPQLLNSQEKQKESPISGGHITGKIIDAKSGEALEYASVALIKSAPVKGTLTNVTGLFVINQIPEGHYTLSVEFMGYNKKEFVLSMKGNIDLGTIPLEPSSKILGAATVEGVKSAKSITIEKSRINFDRIAGSASGNVLNVLKSQPSVTVDNENNIYIRGNKNILLLIDGRPTTHTSLESIPTGNISHIEIITSPDAKYDSEGSGGIINIVSKTKLFEGKSLLARYSTDIHYCYNGGVDVSLNNGLWSFDMGINSKYDHEQTESNIIRELHSTGQKTWQNIISDKRTNLHSAYSTISYSRGKNQAGITLNGMIPNFHLEQDISGRETETGPETYSRHNSIWFNRKSFSGAGFYKRIFSPGKKELSFDISYSKTKGSRPASYTIDGVYSQRSWGGGSPNIFSFQSDYVTVTGSKINVESGVKYTKRWNTFEYDFFNLDIPSNEWIKDISLSNDLTHKEQIFALYESFSGKLSDGFAFKAGLRAEYSTSLFRQYSTNDQSESSRLSLFPSVTFRYSPAEKNSLSLAYNRRVTRPAYPQLNPFVNIIDQVTSESGNKNLRQELTDKIEAAHEFSQGKITLNSSIYYSHTRDYIAQTTQITSDGKLMLSYTNIPSYNKVGADISASMGISPFISLSPALSVYYGKTRGEISGLSLNSKGTTLSGSIELGIHPDKFTDIQLNYKVTTPQYLPQFYVEGYQSADASVRRRFFKGKITAELLFVDIFDSNEWNVKADNHVFRITNFSKSDLRSIWLSLSLNLNSFKIKSRKAALSEEPVGAIRM